ncbi:MAG: hypothetical protein U0796_16860 [Gemmatales bacterium]
MHRYALSLVIIITLLGVCHAQDDGMPHLELIRGLRDRGYHDTALTYLEKLKAQSNRLAPEVKAALALELARSRSDVASSIPPGTERDRLLQTSRTELEAFLKTNPSPGLAAEGEQALANCLAEQARSLAASADRAGITTKAGMELQKQSLARFDEADRKFATLQKTLEDQLGIKLPEKTASKNANQPPPRSSPLYLSTLYYRALTRYDKSRVSGLGVRDSGLANDEAQKIAEKLSLFRSVSSAGWQGYALYARTLEGADDNKANQIYRTIDSASTPNAIPAQRAIRYYPLARADAAGELTDKGSERDRIKGQAERWLNLYSSLAGNSRDAQHVRFMLIRILAKELEETPENRRQTAEAQAKLDRALVLIDQMDNGRAEHLDALERLKYMMLRLSGRAKGPLESLKTVDEALLRSSLEFYTLQGLEAKLKEVGETVAKKDVEAQQRKQIEVTLAALRRTQQLMLDGEVSERQRVRLLNMLQSTLRRTGDGPRAALLCEYLAISSRQPDQAQVFAGEALRLYQFLSRAGGKTDPAASARVIAMAYLLEERFPESEQADEARLILGRDLLSHKQFDAAIAKLTSIKTNPGVPRYLAALGAWTKHRELNKNNLKVKSPEANKAVALLKEAQTALAQQTNKDELTQRTEVQAALLLLGIYETQGDADALIACAQPLLVRIEQKKMPNGLAAGTELQVLEAVIGAYIQKNDFQQGPAKVLAVLSKRPNDSQHGDSTRLLQTTALRIRQQLDELSRQGESSKAQYQVVRESFKNFLQQMERDPKLTLKQRIWLSNNFASIGDHAKAAQLLQDVQAPANTIPDKKTGEADEGTLLYRQAISTRLIALRQAAMSEADANDRDKALAVVEKEMKKIMQEPWARRNPALLRDEILLLQLRGNYSGPRGAITRWDQFRASVRPLLDKSEAMKELYWEANYHLMVAVYEEAQLLKAPEAKQKGTERAASLFLAAQRENFGTPTQAARFKDYLTSSKRADLKTVVDQLSRPIK